MADTILGGNFTVTYLDENRAKSITWSGANDNDSNTMNELYSALMDLFDASAQMDDAVPMSAQTPTEYTVGAIDAGDADPWYISYEAMEHITGGALRTSGWARTQDVDTGIVIVGVTGNTMTKATDVGATMTNGGDTGTLLEIIDDGTNVWLVIRPTDNSITHNWDTGSGTINSSASANSATQAANAITGQQIWANFFSLGTIEPDTHIFGYYGSAATDGDRARITSVNSTTEDWWGDGQIDACIPIRDWKTAGAPIIDSGFATWKAHKFTTEYSFFEAGASTTSGGRNPVPLSTKNDLNNNTGFRQVTLSGASTTALHWNVGDEILGAVSGARAVITAITAGELTATPTFEYYLLAQQPSTTDHFGGALTDFNGSEAINNVDASGTSTGSGATSGTGPSVASWFTNATLPTIAFGTSTADIDNDTTNEDYGITINCQQNPLSEVYEWLKYITRYGATGTTDTDGITGELYKGGEVYLVTGTRTGTVAENNNVSQANTGATGVIVSLNTSNGVALLRDVRGTFNTTDLITDQDGSGTFTPSTAETFAPNPVSPFGTFAGGTFFGARGVELTNWLAANENQFQLTPIEGGTKARPQAFQIQVTNLVGTAKTDATADLVSVHELLSAGGAVNKTQYSSDGFGAAGDVELTVDGTIAADTPTSGKIVIRDKSDNNANYYIRYDGFTTNTFQFPEFPVAGPQVATGGSTTTIQLTGGAFNTGTNVERGDIVYFSAGARAGEHSYVVSVDSATQVTIDPPLTGTASGSTFRFNVAPIDDDTLDDIYVVPLHAYPTSTSLAVSIQFVDTYHYRASVRNNRAGTKIIPFTATGTVTSGTDNQTVQTVRNTDTITT